MSVPTEKAHADLDAFAMSPEASLKLIASALSLTKSELARVLRVSRQTIYEWLRGKDLSPSNDRRLRRLTRLALELGEQSDLALLRRFVVEAPEEGGASLIGLLERETWDTALVAETLIAIQKRSRKREGARADSWLRSLGFPEPDEKARDANLNYNLTVDEAKRSR